MVEVNPVEALIHQAAIVGLLCALLAGLGEWLHQQRLRSTQSLTFGPEGPRGWTKLVPILRTVAALILGFSLWVLAHLESKPPEIDPTQEPSQHLLIALDVSPSMYLEDSGPERNIRRGTRASEVLEAVFQRLDMSRTRVSVVAFYTDAFPVVLESFDINVVNNVLNGLPMEFAFEAGSTQLQQGVEKALSFAKAWPKGSTTLIVVSDGDTVGGSLPARLPLSISDVLVLGVGDPHKGSSVAGRTSRQNIQFALAVSTTMPTPNIFPLKWFAISRWRCPVWRTRRYCEISALPVPESVQEFWPCFRSSWLNSVAGANPADLPY